MPGDKDRNIHPHQPSAHTNRAAKAGAVLYMPGLVWQHYLGFLTLSTNVTLLPRKI